uniref:Uncharacterized protein n=2 Tax=Caenorhabditis japonica TaxID=281687 RepID=A0A8R1ERI0_CAEJA
MTSENGRSGVDNVAQQAAVNKLVAPKVTKYYSVGMSVTGPIKRVLRNTIEATNERLKESNELINTCAENSTPKGDAELDDLLRHRESLKKALIDLQYLPIFVESKLEIPQFLQEPNADTHKSQEEEQRRQHMEMEETKEAQRQANEQEKRRKEATHIAMLQEKIKTAKAAYARNNETIKSANEANLVEFFFSANSSQQKISTEEPENNRKTQANIAKSSETDILRKFHHSFQELEQKNSIAISQSIEAAITKITEGVSKSLYITEKQKQERKLHFHEEENGSVFEDELAEQYMNMGQNDQIGAYQMPENNYSTPQNPQGFTRHMPQDISSIQKEERTYKNGENSMYNQSQSYRKFDRYEKKLTPFDGSGNLGIFRRVFYDYVVENPNLTNDDKYNELARQLIGPAARCLQQLENTEEAVKHTFHELEQVYGGKIDRMDLHEKKKLNVDDERTITPFCQKLPETILNEIMPIVNMESEKLTFIMVHDAVVESIKSLSAKVFSSERNIKRKQRIQGAVYVTDQQRSYPQ